MHNEWFMVSVELWDGMVMVAFCYNYMFLHTCQKKCPGGYIMGKM